MEKRNGTVFYNGMENKKQKDSTYSWVVFGIIIISILLFVGILKLKNAHEPSLPVEPVKPTPTQPVKPTKPTKPRPCPPDGP